LRRPRLLLPGAGCPAGPGPGAVPGAPRRRHPRSNSTPGDVLTVHRRGGAGSGGEAHRAGRRGPRTTGRSGTEAGHRGHRCFASMARPGSTSGRHPPAGPNAGLDPGQGPGPWRCSASGSPAGGHGAEFHRPGGPLGRRVVAGARRADVPCGRGQPALGPWCWRSGGSARGRPGATGRCPPPLADPLLDLRVDTATARSYEVKAGQYIQVIDRRGAGQCSDFLAFCRPPADRRNRTRPWTPPRPAT